MAKNVLNIFDSQVEVDKEILSVLPKNNKKNLKIYKEKAAEIKKLYDEYLDEIMFEIKRRKAKICNISINPRISEINEQIQDLSDTKIINDNITSFEKMELDETLYILRRFYKSNLEAVNENIASALYKFKTVGVDLRADDFNYSIFANEYMKVFLSEQKKGDINSTVVKDKFEEIYWKCSDIITHIELNFRSLYIKNEKTINKYFEDLKKKTLKDSGLNADELLEKNNKLKKQLDELMYKDTYLILKGFLDGNILPKNFEEQSIIKDYKKLLNLDINDVTNDELEEYNKNILKLRNSLFEYKNYLKFKFIFDRILEIYNTKEKYEKKYNTELKKINKLESGVFKTNKKIEKLQRRRGILAKIFHKGNNNVKKLEKINLNVNTKIEDLKNAYRELEENKVYNIISTKLSDSSSIYDSFRLITPFYTFLVDTLIKDNDEISPEEIKTKITGFKEFVSYPNITIINNMKITDNKDIVIVLKDKYNLCNINVTKEDLDADKLENLSSIVDNVCNNYYLNGSKIDLDDIKFVLQANKILEVGG